jgi:hypothetical protein
MNCPTFRALPLAAGCAALLVVATGWNADVPVAWAKSPPLGAATDSAASARLDLPAAGRPSRRPENEKLGERLREGTRLTDVVGSFQSAGDRISFHPDGKSESYRVLENLNLERIDGYLGSARRTPTWTVSVVVTEFRGSNYLLVSKAIVRTVGDAGTAP